MRLTREGGKYLKNEEGLAGTFVAEELKNCLKQARRFCQPNGAKLLKESARYYEKTN